MPDEPTPGARAAADHASFPAEAQRELRSLVAIGASAGGLEACQNFLDGMNSGYGLAFILVQHLDPTHPSLMVDLLTSHTTMTVRQAEDGDLIAPDHVYVIPPGAYLSVEDGRLRLSQPNARHGARLPLDFLLHSIAEAFGKRAQALILSGTGADGSLGLISVKDQGGYVIAQEPTEAGFDGMPLSAIATGRVDRVLPIASIPSALIRHSQGAPDAPPATASPASEEHEGDPHSDKQTMDSIIALLRQETPHDFTTYKPGTLHRRIRRRMVQAGSTNLEAYLDLLKGKPDECALLANDMLINVTAFFRDAKVFDLLEKTIIPDLIKRHETDDPIRIWVPGCSTGEEAYSIAMLFREALVALKRPIKFQVFASDVDPDAVATAREGFYAQAAIAPVSQERLKRYFGEEAHGYRILPELRGAMIFTVQDVLSDPPFSRLDFISCRNLLIYLGAEAQQSVISLLHFALRPGGVMLLGSAETPGAIEGRFEVISKAERLYRHIGRNRLPESKAYRSSADLLRTTVAQKSSARLPARTNFAELCRQAVIETYAPATMLINSAQECLFSVGPISRYLNVSAGYPPHDLMDMLPFGLRSRLKVAITGMGASKSRVQIEGGTDTAGAPFSIDVQPLSHEGEKLFLVGFIAASAATGKRGRVPKASAAEASQVADLERQLGNSRAELADAIRTLEQTGEEQKALHEETLSVNEEFQSTNEELLTSKEELQSLNEELTALNNQLHEALERQRSASNDLQNILYSTDVATLFLDLDLKIRYFTPATRALFHVIPGDIGRPLADLASLAVDAALPQEARAVLTSLAPIEREVKAENGTWFLRRILPYRADDSAVEGVVITFTDISDRKQTEKALEVIAKALDTAKKQAEAANLAKSRFLAAASHDLRQPLQSLTLIQGLLAKNVENDKARQLVLRLDQTLGAITGMMNTLLDINQIEAGAVEANPVRFPVHDLLERMKDAFQLVAQAQKLDLRVVASSQVIRSDPRLLEQMIRNLISNALKYTRHGKILLGCRRHAHGLSIEIWDTGIGIAEDQLTAIFNEYHQIGNEARERNRGMGLGLAIVQRLGDLLGHRIGVRSRSGRGSVFAIEIAFDQEDALPVTAQTVLAPNSDVPRQSGNVLVVEDDPEVSELLELHLAGEGHRVTIARDGAAALALLGKSGFRPDIVLADYNLPGMDGLALTRALREKLGAKLPVIILTGDISSETLRLIADGEAKQLNKPVSTAELSAAIQHKLALTLSDKPVTPVDTPHAIAAPASGSLVFVIDDDAAIRENLTAMLEDAGMAVAAFSSCEAFLAVYPPHSGACIVIDAYLPGMSGLALLNTLRTSGNVVPAIMVTGRSDVAIAVEAMKAGAVDFIEKPVRAAALLASIAHAIELGQGSLQKRGWHEEAKKRLARLTSRQREIMDLVLAGHPNKNISADLGISQRTVENHRAAIMLKTGSKSLPALARLAFVLAEPA